jgi:hypothetical protein
MDVIARIRTEKSNRDAKKNSEAASILPAMERAASLSPRIDPTQPRSLARAVARQI